MSPEYAFACKNTTILDIAIKYRFGNGDTFSRAFKRIVGCNPSTFKIQKSNYNFERVNILDKYYDVQDKTMLEKYPEIKVLKEIEPMKVAYFHAFGDKAEGTAMTKVWDFAKRNNLLGSGNNHRFFGFDNNSPTEHGYEFWMTVNDDVIRDEYIKIKTFEGGKFIVMNTPLSDIINAWKRLQSWCEDSKYRNVAKYCLEEHLIDNDQIQNQGFDEICNGLRLDLYLAIE